MTVEKVTTFCSGGGVSQITAAGTLPVPLATVVVADREQACPTWLEEKPYGEDHPKTGF